MRFLIAIASVAFVSATAHAQFVYRCRGPGPGVPANDCATAPAQIATDGTPVVFDSSGASTDGPPQLQCGSGNYDLPIHKDLWWRFLAPANGTVVISNCSSSDFDSKIALYAIGSDLAAFDPQLLPSMFLKCNDDCEDSLYFTSLLEVTGIRAGRYYLVRLGGYRGSSGSGTLSVTLIPTTPTAPDPCAAGNLIAGIEGENTVTLPTNYPPLIMDPHCGSFSGAIYRARMVRFQPSASGIVEIGNCGDAGAAADARIAVMTACGAPVTTIACADEGCPGAAFTGRLLASVIAGTNYYIAVGGRTESVTGPIRLRISAPCPIGLGDPEAEAVCACLRSDLNPSGSVDGADLGALLAFWGPASPAFPQADISGDGMVDGADLGILLSSWGPCPSP
jgi:hypothetical protein